MLLRTLLCNWMFQVHNVIFSVEKKGYGAHHTVFIPAASLTWLLNLWELVLWLKTLQVYDFDICHRACRLHSKADALSWQPCEEEQ